jgi:hypothetical protein
LSFTYRFPLTGFYTKPFDKLPSISLRKEQNRPFVKPGINFIEGFWAGSTMCSTSTQDV